MAEMTNDLRAEWAEDALRAFMKRTGQTDEVEALGDLLGDLHHYVERLWEEDMGNVGHDVKYAWPGVGPLPMIEAPGLQLMQDLMDKGQDYYLEEVREVRHVPH